MGKNGYLQKMQQMKQGYLEIGQEVGIQMMADFLPIVLNNADVMGKDTFGAKRINKVLDELKEMFSVYAKAFGTGPEADYFRQRLDDRLKQIMGEEKFMPFEDRYRWLCKIKY